MIKKTITFTDYNNEVVTEDYYFDLNKAELIKLEAEQGGLEQAMQRAIRTTDAKKIYSLFEQILKDSYGEKSIDGRRFVKDPEQTKAFLQSPAFSELIVEMIQDPSMAAAFMKGVLPKMPEDHKSGE